MKKSVSFNEKLNEILDYDKGKKYHLEEYLINIQSYLNQENIKKEDNNYMILKSGKKIKKVNLIHQ
jgi:hypothetical protein